ncbi:MAG: SagB/ThcOx family dehydrogenase [Acidobacteria bacterium]|nr:SagB/ThcOx family dehydrogenase [Acidobacteriota bacterium]
MASKTAIKLPKPEYKSKMTVEEAIAGRRTRRNFSEQPLTINELSLLLWSGQGVTEERWKHRATPSAGALYPLSLYISIKTGGVQGLDAGLYRYVPEGHYLQVREDKDISASLVDVGYSQTFFAKSPICIVITSIPKKTTWKYGKRGTQYIHFEVGHVAENIQLLGEALGLSVGLVGAFQDDKVSELLKLREGEIPLYIIPVGRRVE